MYKRSLFMAALLGAQATYAQNKSAFTLYPDVFSQGDTIQAVYRPELAGYNDSAGVRASVYLFRNFSWEGYDLPIHKTDSGWVSSYVLPSGTAMIDFHFFMGDSIDKGDRFPYAAVPVGVSLIFRTVWGIRTACISPAPIPRPNSASKPIQILDPEFSFSVEIRPIPIAATAVDIIINGT